MTEGTHILPDGEHLAPASDFVQGVTNQVFALGGWEAVAGCSLSVLARVLLAQEGFTSEHLYRGIAAALANNGAAAMTAEGRILMLEEIEDHLLMQIDALETHIRTAPGHGHA